MASRIIYDETILKSMLLFENMTHAKVKDCISVPGMMIFIVQSGEMAKAIGPQGSHVRRIENALKKRIKVVEFCEVPETFFASLAAPAKVNDIQIENKIMFVTASDLTSRGMMIGHGATILRLYETVCQRYFDIIEIKVK